MTDPHAQINLPLNGTRIVFLHAGDTGLSAPCAVQIDTKAREQDVEVADEGTSREISDLLVKLAVAHLRNPLPRQFVLDGDAYSITALRKKWKYGQKRLLMTWGDERILPCEDKWTFVLSFKDRRCSS